MRRECLILKNNKKSYSVGLRRNRIGRFGGKEKAFAGNGQMNIGWLTRNVQTDLSTKPRLV